MHTKTAKTIHHAAAMSFLFAWSSTTYAGLESQVLDTIKNASGIQTVEANDIEAEQWGHVAAFEYAWTADNQQHEVVVSNRGDILATETVLQVAELPVGVRQAAAQLGWTRFMAERIELIAYELEYEDAEGEHEIIVLPWGQMVSESWLSGGLATSHNDGDHEDKDDDDDNEHEDVEVALQDIPGAVLATAERVLPGIKLLEAEIQQGPGNTEYYQVEGRSGSDLYEIAITADGKLLEVEIDTDDAIDDDNEL